MPEIGECSSIAKVLNKEISGEVLEGKTNSSFQKNIFKGSIHPKELRGTKLVKIQSFGKSIWFYFKKGEDYFVLVSQLGMSGSWFINDTMTNREHFHLQLKIGKNWVKYSDPRMFGKVEIFKGTDLNVLSDEIIKKKKWGVDPLLNPELIYEQILKMRKGSKSIKEKLLEQNLIFGIGNYLASEVLFDARINPKRQASSLTEKECKDLSLSIKKWVNLAVESGGFSFAGGYILPDGSFGDLRDKIQIYQKDGNKCPSCGKKVIKEFMGGRATFFCNSCQR